MSHAVIIGARLRRDIGARLRPDIGARFRRDIGEHRSVPRLVRPVHGNDRSLIDRHIAANFYPTPPEATRALLSVESFDGPIWEPACGKGHIARVLEAASHQVVSTDLNDWGYGTPNVNFLDERTPRARHIITNPPYGSGLADDFVTRVLAMTGMTGGKVAMLLNLASLAHERRTAEWRRNPPARLYAIDGIVCWPDPVRRPPKHFLQHRYIWAVWESGFTGRPAFWWLSAGDFAA